MKIIASLAELKRRCSYLATLEDRKRKSLRSTDVTALLHYCIITLSFQIIVLLTTITGFISSITRK